MTQAVTLSVQPGPHAGLLSCVDANLESLLAHRGVSDLLTVLGGPCGLAASPLRHIVLRPVAIGDWIRACTGLELVCAAEPDAARALTTARRVVAAGYPVLVTVDAYTVPWSPYCQHEHHEHGFVIDGFAGGAPGTGVPADRAHIVDSYTNATRYGRAGPQAMWLDTGELRHRLGAFGEAVTVSHLAGRLVPAGDPLARTVETVRLNQRAALAARRQGQDVAALAEHPWHSETIRGMQWLSLATWLAARSRGLHARWWQQIAEQGLPGAPGVIAGYGLRVVEPAWQQAQTAAYLAWRRVETGRPCPPGVAQSLAEVQAAEREWFDRMGAWLETVSGFAGTAERAAGGPAH